MREGLKPLVFVLQTTAGILLHAQRGGWNTIFGLGLPQPHSSICLIPLWLSPVNRPAMSHEKKKAGTRATPPQKKPGGHADPDSWHLEHASIPVPMGSLSSSFIPAGRLGTAPRRGRQKPRFSNPFYSRPPFPLALHCVGSVLAVKGSLRRFAPWTARTDPEDALLTRGEGGSGRGVRGRVASPLAHDKGYYHSGFSRSS